MNVKAPTAQDLLNSIVLSKGRMEALTDGIFAIAMTLLVLELKIPDLPKTTDTHELLQHIGLEAPAFFSFLVSFLYCGLLWVKHHMAMHFLRHMNMILVWLNLLFLMSISIMPFSCDLLGHFLHNGTVEEIYFGNMFAASSLLALQWLVAKQKKLLNVDDPLTAQVMGHDIIFLPIALGAAMAAIHFMNRQAGFYTLAAVLLSLRFGQKIWLKRQTKNP